MKLSSGVPQQCTAAWNRDNDGWMMLRNWR